MQKEAGDTDGAAGRKVTQDKMACPPDQGVRESDASPQNYRGRHPPMPGQ